MALYVKVSPQDQTSVYEQIVTQLDAPGLRFERNDAEGLSLIERIYNPQIAQDFQTSKFVAQIGNTDVYQGKKFTYTTAQAQGIQRFSVFPANSSQKVIQREISCQSNNCVVYQPFYSTTATQ